MRRDECEREKYSSSGAVFGDSEMDGAKYLVLSNEDDVAPSANHSRDSRGEVVLHIFVVMNRDLQYQISSY